MTNIVRNSNEVIIRHLGLDWFTTETSIFPLFFRFLKERSLFEKFAFNMRNVRLTGSYVRSPKECLLHSFIWSDSKERHSFWEDINDEWNKYLDEFYYY